MKKFFKTIKKARLFYRMYLKNLSCGQAAHLLKTGLQRTISASNAPLSVLLGVTYECQCDCSDCGVAGEKKDPEKELDFCQIKKIVSELKRMLVINVTLTGGEPLLRKDIFDIIKFISRTGLIVCLDTNGILLDEKTLRSLKRSGLNLLKVSLDSSDPYCHDRLRGYPGCFNKASQGLIGAVRLGLSCVSQTYVTPEAISQDRLKGIIDFARKNGLSGACLQKVKPAGRLKNKSFADDSITSYISRNTGGLAYFSNLAVDLGKPGSSEKEFYISPYGRVQSSMFNPVSFGDVKEKNLTSIFNEMRRSL